MQSEQSRGSRHVPVAVRESTLNVFPFDASERLNGEWLASLCGGLVVKRGENLVGIDRLRQVARGAEPHALEGSRDASYRSARRSWWLNQLFQRCDHVQPGFPRQTQVDEREFRCPGLRHGDGLFVAAGADGFEAANTECPDQWIKRPVIVDDQEGPAIGKRNVPHTVCIDIGLTEPNMAVVPPDSHSAIRRAVRQRFGRGTIRGRGPGPAPWSCKRARRRVVVVQSEARPLVFDRKLDRLWNPVTRTTTGVSLLALASNAFLTSDNTAWDKPSLGTEIAASSAGRARSGGWRAPGSVWSGRCRGRPESRQVPVRQPLILRRVRSFD